MVSLVIHPCNTVSIKTSLLPGLKEKKTKRRRMEIKTERTLKVKDRGEIKETDRHAPSQEEEEEEEDVEQGTGGIRRTRFQYFFFF